MKSAKIAGFGLQSHDVNQRYGEAAKEYIKAYFGETSPDGKIVRTGLKHVKKYKLHPDYRKQNLSQQAGTASEIHYESKINANNAISGSSERISRTDNIPGMKNHTKFDHIKVDTKGVPKLSSSGDLQGSQMKIYGIYDSPSEVPKSAEKLVNKLASEKWDRYRGSPVDVATDHYRYIEEYTAQKVTELQKQADYLKSIGEIEKANQIEAKAQRFRDIKVRDSKISIKLARMLRESPGKATVKFMTRNAHNAGMAHAKDVVVLSGVISGAQNIVALVNGDKELKEALIDTSKDTLTGAGIAYTVGSGGSLVKGFMESSSNTMIQQLSKTTLPTFLVTTSIQVGQSLNRYFKGEINEIELVEELGEKGTGMVAASMGAAIGTSILPGIGTAIGGMVGYLASSQVYNSALQLLAEERYSAEERERVHQFAERALKEMEQQQRELEIAMDKYFSNRKTAFVNCFKVLDQAVLESDYEMFSQGLIVVAEVIGVTLQFKGFNEFNKFMSRKEGSLVL